MQALGLLGSGSFLSSWRSIPAKIMVLIVVALSLFGAAELTIMLNNAMFSHSVALGNAAAGEAQAVDPVKTLADLRAGKPGIPGAYAKIAVEYAKTDAEAQIAQQEALAATESKTTLQAKEDEDRASAAEQMKLRDLKLREKDIELRELEAALRQQETLERGAIADASVETEPDLIRKEARGTLTATENLKLQQIRRERGEAVVSQSKAYSAPYQAELEKNAAIFGTNFLRSIQSGRSGAPNNTLGLLRSYTGR
jgi:hypothetical protein